jgi:hypothetical protein
MGSECLCDHEHSNDLDGTACSSEGENLPTIEVHSDPGSRKMVQGSPKNVGMITDPMLERNRSRQYISAFCRLVDGTFCRLERVLAESKYYELLDALLNPASLALCEMTDSVQSAGAMHLYEYSKGFRDTGGL